MPVGPHILRAPAALGIDESKRKELVEYGAANLRGENIRGFREGEAQTRYGFAAMTNSRIDATVPGAAYKMFTCGDTTVRITDALKAEAYSSHASAWVSVGRVPEIDFSTVDIPNTNSTSAPEDVEYCNGYLAVTTGDSTSTSLGQVTILDATTMSIVSAPASFGIAFVASFSSRYFVVLSAHSEDFSVYILDTLSASTINTGWVLLATIGADFSNGFPIAMCSLTDRIALAYVPNTGGASQLRVKTYDQTGLRESTTVNTSSITPDACDIRGDLGGTLWVAWNEGVSVKMKGLTYNSLATVLATTALIITNATGSGNISISPSSTTAGRIIVNDADETNIRLQMRGFQTSGSAAAPLGTQITVYNALHCSRPFYYGTRHYVQAFGACISSLVNYGNGQRNLMIVDWTDDVNVLRPVVNLTPGLALSSYHGKAKTVVGPDATVLYTVTGVLRSGVGNAANLLALDFASLRCRIANRFGSSTFLSGGMLSVFTSTRTFESGFMIRPAKVGGSAGAVGTLSGTYRCVAVYEEIDSDGNWHVSGLSDPSGPITALLNSTITAVSVPLTITSRSSTTLRVAFYFTLSGGEPPYYRSGTVTNDPTLPTVTYLHTLTDTALAANAVLYSQPGVPGTALDRRAPPGLKLITSYNGMLVGACGSDIWWSGQSVSGEATWFNPDFQVPIPGDGDIIALAAMDGTLFALKNREIYAIAGDAPSDNGQSGGLGTPRRLAVDSGAVDAFTCTTAMGIVFHSDRGIELLSRAQAVVWLGVKIQDLLEDFPIVTAMTVDPSNQGTLLIDLAASEATGFAAGEGRTAVYDFTINEWISRDRRANSTASASAPAQSACIISTSNGFRYAWLASSGVVHVEDRTTHLDADGSFVVPLIETGWYNAFQNEQSVLCASLMFYRYTAAGLKIEKAFDYGDYDAANDSEWTDLDTTGQRLLEVYPIDPRVESVKFRITTTAPLNSAELGTGQGIGFIGLSLDIAAKQGPVRGTLRVDPELRR